MLVRADWVVSWGLGVAAWRLGCMTSFSCLLLLGRDVPSRWHFTGILEHINNSQFSYLQQVALRVVPSMTVSWRRRKSPTEALGEKGAMESQFKAGNPKDKEGWMSRRGRCPPRIDFMVVEKVPKIQSRKSTAWHCASPSLGGGASASRAAGPGLASRGRASHNCRPATEEGVSVRPRSAPTRGLSGQLAPCSSALASGPTCRVDSARKIDPARRGNLEGSLLFSRSRSASSS